jgi:hypothetical protein
VNKEEKIAKDERLLFRSALGALSIIMVFAGLNDHFDPTYIIFVFIKGGLGRFGVFIFSGVLSAFIYLALSRMFLEVGFKDNLGGAKKVAITSYILLLIIWSYLYFVFKPA